MFIKARHTSVHLKSNVFLVSFMWMSICVCKGINIKLSLNTARFFIQHVPLIFDNTNTYSLSSKCVNCERKLAVVLLHS